MNIDIYIPTRGLVFGDVLESVCAQTMQYRDFSLSVRSGHDVPDVFNHCVEESLNTDAIMFVEEDTVPPMNCLEEMRQMLFMHDDIGAVCVDYPLPGDHSCIVRHEETNEILWCGLGCTMIKTEVFHILSAPWFRSDWQFLLEPAQLRGWRTCDPTKQYGLYDVLFFTRMRAAGYLIAQAPGQCRHLKTDGNYTSQQNGSVLKITQKATVCTPSLFPVDPKDFWKESLHRY